MTKTIIGIKGAPWFRKNYQKLIRPWLVDTYGGEDAIHAATRPHFPENVGSALMGGVKTLLGKFTGQRPYSATRPMIPSAENLMLRELEGYND